MKIIQSFWSKPFEKPYDDSFESRFMGGFPLKRYFIYTWALSILRLKEHFNDVHLVTDDFGKQLMIDALEFPYSTFSTELNEIADIPSKFWCSGKLHAFAKTKQPFLHFDGDVILGDNFNKNITSKNIIAEYHYEDKPKIYQGALNYLKDEKSNFIKTNKIIEIINAVNYIYKDYNLGIVGGNDYAFLNEFAIESIKLIERNKSVITTNEFSPGFLNCFIEQFSFYNLVQEKGKIVDLCITTKFDTIYDYQRDILNQITTNFSFIHLHNTYKLNYYTLPEKWLKSYYPKIYDKINMVIFGKIIK